MKRTTKKLITGAGQFAADTLKGIGGMFRDLLVNNFKIVLVLLAVLWFYDNRVDMSSVQAYLDSDRSTFREGETAKYIANYRDDTLIIHRKGQQPELITGIKEFESSQFDDGRIEIDYKNKGFGLEPGLVATTGDGLRLGVDVEYAYWKRYGLLAGVTMPVSRMSLDRLRGHLGVSYDLPSKWFSNTSLYGGIDTNKNPAFGIRTKLGGGI